MQRRRVPPALVNQLREEYRGILSITRLSKKYGYSVKAIWNVVKPIIKELKRNRLHRINSSTREAIRYDYPHISIKELAKKYGISTVSVYAHTRDIRKDRFRNKIFDLENSLNKLDDFQKGYLIAMLEGEGYIGVEKRRKGGLAATLVISNTNKQIIDYLQSLLRGIIEKKKSRGKRWKECFVWRQRGSAEILLILEHLKKYFIGKQKQVKLLIIFCRLREHNKHHKYGEKEYEIYQKLKVLNKRGNG